MGKYIKVKRLLKTLALAALCIAFLLAAYLTKDMIVILYGISAYRIITKLLAAVLALVLIWGIFLFVENLLYARRAVKGDEKLMAEYEEAKKEEERAAREEKEPLSVKKDMDSAKLRRILEREEVNKWPEYTQLIYKCITHLNEMDKQQEKLEHLISVNGADALSDTGDVLNDAEQYICKNVRKAINYMGVANRNNKEESRKVEEQLKKAVSENEKVLEQVSKFLFAMADFLNSQGDDGDEMQKLNLYKDTILKYIGE